ncbi:MAG: tetratricopeptide repeat protein [Microscillaceae bacterium]|nr:tetratricopeptide repeat protein [Microscillaceae bacterium]
MKFTQLSLPIVLLFGIVSIQSLAQTAQEYFQAAKRNLELGDFQQAIKNFDLVISLEPSNYQAFAQRAFAKSKLMLLADAITDYDKAILINPNDTWILGSRGILKIQVGDYQEAVADFDRSLQLDPKDPWDYVMRGEAKYLAIKNNIRPSSKFSYYSVVDDLSRAASLDPNFGFAFMRRAQARLDSLQMNLLIPSTKDMESICDDWLMATNSGAQEAITYLQQNCGIQIADVISEKTSTMAKYHAVQKEYNKSLALYNTLVGESKGQPEKQISFLFERAELQFSQGKFYEAINDYSQLISYLIKNPDKKLSGKAYYLRGLAQSRSNNTEEALDDYNQAVDLGYQFSWVYYERGLAYNMLANKEAACQDWGISAEKGHEQALEMLREHCKTGFSLFKKKD